MHLAIGILSGLFLGILVSGCVLGVKGLNTHHLGPSPDGFALRRPWEQRVFLGLMGLMCLVAPMMVALDNLQPHKAGQAGFWPLGAIFTALCLTGVPLFCWAGGPQELAVDEKQRTYRRSEGWLLWRRVYAGPLSDLSGVWTEYGTRGNYMVFVGWRAGPGPLMVERFWGADGAAYYARELADVLGIPSLEARPSASVTAKNP